MGGWQEELARRQEGRALGSDTRGHFLPLLMTLRLGCESFRLTSPPWTSVASVELSCAHDGKEKLVCELLDGRHSLMWLLPVVEVVG